MKVNFLMMMMIKQILTACIRQWQDWRLYFIWYHMALGRQIILADLIFPST